MGKMHASVKVFCSDTEVMEDHHYPIFSTIIGQPMLVLCYAGLTRMLVVLNGCPLRICHGILLLYMHCSAQHCHHLIQYQNTL